MEIDDLDISGSGAYPVLEAYERGLSISLPREGATDRLSASIAFVSTMPPRQCGLAAFTAALIEAVQGASTGVHCLAVPVAKEGKASFSLSTDEGASYRAVAEVLNGNDISLVCLQHEYGIFGGPDGEMVLDFLETLSVPVAVTLHTVLDHPSANQKRVLDAVCRIATRIVVMTEHSAQLVRQIYHVGSEKLRIIPHGIPDLKIDRAKARQRLGLADRPTLLTFGLISPDKGIEHVIKALPAIRATYTDILYRVMGVTHPNLLRKQGESYRDSLLGLARDLDVKENVCFVNRFADLPELANALAAADLYITPYLNQAQSVSGTLAYSYGMGSVVISTPFRHACELLRDGRGMLVPFADPPSIARTAIELLGDCGRMAAMRRRALTEGRGMTWSIVGARYVEMFEELFSSPEIARR